MQIDKVSSIIKYMVFSLILSCQIKMYHIVMKEYVYEVSIYLVGPVLMVISGILTFSAEGSHFPNFCENNDITTLTCAPLDPV